MKIKYNQGKLNSIILLIFIFMSSILYPIKKYMGNGNIVWIVTFVVIIISLLINKGFERNFFMFLYIILMLFLINLVLVDTKNIVLKEIFEIIKFGIIPVYLASNKLDIKEFIKFLYIISIINVIVMLSSLNDVINREGMTYMDFGINMSLSFWGISIKHYTNIKKKLLDSILLIIIVIAIFLFGNRSSIIICIFISIFLWCKYANERLFILKTVPIISICLVIYMNLYSILILINNFMTKYNIKLYSIQKYIMAIDSGIIKSSSGRDYLFHKALEITEGNNLLPMGLGYFKLETGINYPHNIFLDSMIVLGGVGTIILALFIILKFVNVRTILCNNTKNIIYTFGIFTFIWLLFSSSFLTDFRFWTVIGFLLNKYFYKKEVLK